MNWIKKNLALVQRSCGGGDFRQQRCTLELGFAFRLWHSMVWLAAAGPLG